MINIIQTRVRSFFTTTSLFSGGVDAVPSPAAVYVLPQSQVTTGPVGDGGPSHCLTTAVGPRDQTGVRHVRHKDQFRLPNSALRAQVIRSDLRFF